MQNKTLFAFSLFVSTASFAMGSKPPPSDDPTMPISRYYEVETGLFRGGRPGTSGMEALANKRFDTVIDLEDSASAINAERADAARLHMNFVSVEFSALKTPADVDVDTVLSTMKDPSEQPVFVHCHEGRDRTGLIVGLHRVLKQGWDPKVAYDEMLKIGFRPMFKALDNYYRKRTAMGVFGLVGPQAPGLSDIVAPSNDLL